MPVLSDDQWKTLILSAIDDTEGVVGDQLDTLWLRYAYLANADPAGDLRYYAVLRDSLDLLLGPASKDVQVSEGGGQSGSFNQHFDHLKLLRDQASKDYEARLAALNRAGGISVDGMSNGSLTPVLPGYIDPGSPAYTGDPRYRFGGYWPYGTNVGPR